MVTVILESFRDQGTGEIGLGLMDMPRDETTNAATSGVLLAHDLLEHVNGPERIGTIDDELEALGALWYVRGQHNDLSRDSYGSFYSVEENIARDVVRMFRDHWYGASVDLRKRYTRPCEADHAIDGVLEFAERSYRAEIDTDDVPLADVRKAWRAYKAAVRHRMRTGYRKAYRRWERHGRHAANSMFWRVADAVQPYTRAEFEGQQFKLTYGDGRAYCEEHFPEE